jgi:hypothetical protein
MYDTAGRRPAATSAANHSPRPPVRVRRSARSYSSRSAGSSRAAFSSSSASIGAGSSAALTFS